jgi:tetratricopeptide (TPR) repeat protein
MRRSIRRLQILTLAAAVGFGAAYSLNAQTSRSSARTAWVSHTQTNFVVAQKRFESEPTNNAAAWEFARAGFDRAEFSTNDSERAAIAVQGIDACRKLLARDSNSAPGHYYLGMNLGQLARTKLFGALKIVNEMEREFKAARSLDQHLHYAGPDRNLGLLYFEAPTIGSVGSKIKAREHLQKAAVLAPDYPENPINLAEAYLKWQEKKALRSELQAIDKLWPAAKTNFAGADWAAAWPDWERRRNRLREKATESLNR